MLQADDKWRRLVARARMGSLDNVDPRAYPDVELGTNAGNFSVEGQPRAEGTATKDHQLLESFLLDCRVRNLRPATLACYADRLEILVRWSRGLQRTLGTLTRENIEPLILRALDSGLSAHTINGRLRVWKRFYGYLLGEEMIGLDPTERICLLKADETEPEILTPEQVKSLLSQFKRKIFYAQRGRCIILVLLDTMIRVGELVSIRVDDIDFVGGTIPIRHSKSRRQRVVPLSPTTLRALHQYLNQFRDTRPGGHFFCYDDGRPMTALEVRQIIMRAGRRIGLRVYPHLLRHTGATWYIKDGGHAPVLQKLLGHADYRTTERYVHLAGQEVIQEHYKHSPVNRLVG